MGLCTDKHGGIQSHKCGKNENKRSTNARTHFHCKNNRDGRAFGSRFTNELREEVSNYTRLDRDGAEHVSTWLVCFLEDEHLSSLAVHPSVHRFPEAPGGREGSVMNERRWRTPKAMISDPPPTSQHRQKDNEREKKKSQKYVTSQASKQGRECKRWELRFLLPPLLLPFLLLLPLFWFKSRATLVEIWGGWEKITRPTKRLSL